MPDTDCRTSPFLRLMALIAVVAVCLSFFAPAQPAFAAVAFALTDTVDVGQLSRSVEVDDDRVYVPIDRGDEPGSLTWMNAEDDTPSGTQIDLGAESPQDVLASADGRRIYVLHSGNGKLNVVDPSSNSVTATITGLPKWPGGLVEDTDTGLLYVYSDDGLVTVDPNTAEVSEPKPVSKEAYPLVKDAIYDSTNHMIWIAEGRKNVITGYSTIAGKWVETLAVPVAKHTVDGQEIGGRPAGLAYDEELGEVHVLVQPTLRDEWPKNLVISFRTEDTKYVGTPIEVGENAYSIATNPVTHEIYTADGFSNTVSAISPDTWSSSTAVDFNAEGITEGTGSGNADTWALDVSEDGQKVYVTHPYSDRLSVISRSGAVPTPTTRPEAPGQDDGNEPTTPVNENWEGPATPAPSEGPAGASAIDEGELSWSVNDYMQAWEPLPLGETKKDENDFVFGNAQGWWDEDSGTADLVWADGIHIQHYPILAPTVETTIGNPRLQIREDGSGSLSVDTAWELDEAQRSESYTRATIATFSEAEIKVEGRNLTLKATPEFAGRPYTLDGQTFPDSYPAEFIDALDPQMRRWWMTTGASMDAKKVPNPLSLSIVLGDESQTEEPVPNADDDAGVDTDDDAGADDNAGVDREGTADDSGEDPNGSDDDGAGSEPSDGAGGAASGADNGKNDAGEDSSTGPDSSREDPEAGGHLPRTGASPAVMVSLALGLGLIGLVLVTVARRKRGNASA